MGQDDAPGHPLGARPRVWSGRAHWMIFLVCKNPVGRGPIARRCAWASAWPACWRSPRPRCRATISPDAARPEIGEGGQAYSDAVAEADIAQAALNLSVPFDMVDLGRAVPAR